MKTYAPPQAAETIPVIDISGPEPEVAAAIGKACREIGFFYVAGHGIPDELIAGQFGTARDAFAISEADKRALHMSNSPSASGFEPIGAQILDSQDDDEVATPSDLKESFYCITNDPQDNPRAPASGEGHNQWPSIAGFREQTLAYGEAIQRLGDRVLELLALSLDLPCDWFEPFYEGAAVKLRMLRYPPRRSMPNSTRSAPAPTRTGAASPCWRRTISAGSKYAT